LTVYDMSWAMIETYFAITCPDSYENVLTMVVCDW